MINKKFSMIAVVLLVAVGSTIYGINELAPPGITIVTGHAQYTDRTFEEEIDAVAIVVEGKIQDVQIQKFIEEFTETDADGNKVVFDTYLVPRAKVTIQIKEILKDDYGIDSEFVTAYDGNVRDAIGEANGVKVRFISHDAMDYQVGDKGIFLIDHDIFFDYDTGLSHDRGLELGGFTSFYKIKNGESTIQTEFGKKYHHENPIELLEAKETIKRITKEDKDSQSP